MNWGDLGAAIALMLIFEGLLPFIAPTLWKRSVSVLLSKDVFSLRKYGLLLMIIGLLLLTLIRS